MAGPFKLKSQGSSFKMMGSSPAKHKMKVKKGGHGIGGMGYMPGTTAEEVKAHDAEYGEGHDDFHRQTTKAGRVVAKIANTAAGAGAAAADAYTGEKVARSRKPTYKEAWDNMSKEKQGKHGSYEAFVETAKKYKAGN
mgnify:CR=1 FL=1